MYANRGRAAKLVIELTLRSYAEQGIAQVQKVPTPWVVTRRGGPVAGAFPAKKSTVDYIGVWNGKAVAFDAKEVGEPRFPLSRIPEHQLQFLERFAGLGGIAGVLAWFYAQQEFWWLPAGLLLEAETEGARSLSLARIRETAILVPQGSGVSLDLVSTWMRLKEGGSSWKTASQLALAANG